MLDAGEELGFVKGSRGIAERIGSRVHTFDGHMATQKLVIREVNSTFAARAELAVDHIAPADHRGLDIGFHSRQNEQGSCKTQAAICFDFRNVPATLIATERCQRTTAKRSWLPLLHSCPGGVRRSAVHGP